MTDSTLNSQETQIPENISLEKRFDIEETEGKIEFNTEKTVENVSERNVAEKDSAYQDILAKVKSQHNNNDDTIMQDASSLHQQTDRESQITRLIDLAMTKGVVHAVKVAQKAEDYYVLDQLHDRLLADELHEALISNGLIEK